MMKGDLLVGIITDGDIRRSMEKELSPKATAGDIMSISPKVMDSKELAVQAFQMMESTAITQVIVVNDGKYYGMVHLHDILKEGIY